MNKTVNQSLINRQLTYGIVQSSDTQRTTLFSSLSRTRNLYDQHRQHLCSHVHVPFFAYVHVLERVSEVMVLISHGIYFA